MDPLVAAATLGVSPDAGPDEVQRAFRSMARAAHPDSATAHPAMLGGVDLDSLTEARDALLASRGPSDSPRKPIERVAATRSPAAARVGAARADRGNHRPGMAGVVWAMVLGGLALMVVGIGALAVISLTGGSADDVVDDSSECVVAGPSGVRAVRCTDPEAQLVVDEYSGARTCGGGTNTLVVGATTWCLRPVD